MTYLDHNASSPLLPVARAAWLEAVDRYPGNPSSPHRLGARADAALGEAQQRLATMLGCSPFEVVWTSGATEACNLVLVQAAANGGSDEVWLSAIEHPAVLVTARHLLGSRVQIIPAGANGVVEMEWLQENLKRAKPALVAIMAANNETGILQPWREALARCAAAGVSFFCDATQWCGRLPAAGLGSCDFVAGSAHKFGGPRGVGFLKVPARGRVHPMLRGGKQQEGRRAGTENVAGVLAMLAALTWCEEQMARGEHRAHQSSRDDFERELARRLPGTRVNGGNAPRLWNTSNAIMPVADCRQRWVVRLDKLGFAVSTGSACASGTEEPSHVLSAMGLTAGEAARALRFSGSWTTTPAEWTALLDALQRTAAEAATVSSVETGSDVAR